MTPRNRVSLILSALLVVIGIVTLIRTAVGGGSGVAVGYIFGAALLLAGLGRGWLALQMSRRD
jgi:hypothetical protein